MSIGAFAHITGGGITENIPRVMPNGYIAEIYEQAWSLPSIFTWIKKLTRCLGPHSWVE